MSFPHSGALHAPLCECILAGQRGQEADLDAFESEQRTLLTLLAHVKTLVLTTAARRDPLTGLPMRFGLEQEFALCCKDVKRRGECLYLVMVDIDHFKRVNDTYGHPVGDVALQRIATALKSTVRENEPLYRFGGEEFLILMRCQTPDCPAQASGRILEVIRETPITTSDGLALHLTVTLGIARVGDHEDLASAIKRADIALYEGKHGGRDCFVVAPDIQDSKGSL